MMLTNVAFNMYNYIRSQVFSHKEEDEADREFEEYSGHVVKKATPFMHNLEKKARK